MPRPKKQARQDCGPFLYSLMFKLTLTVEEKQTLSLRWPTSSFLDPDSSDSCGKSELDSCGKSQQSVQESHNQDMIMPF